MGSHLLDSLLNFCHNTDNHLKDPVHLASSGQLLATVCDVLAARYFLATMYGEAAASPFVRVSAARGLSSALARRRTELLILTSLMETTPEGNVTSWQLGTIGW